jgi:hypothetical protein
MAKVLAEQNGSKFWLTEVDQAYTALDDISQYIADNERVKDA